MSIEVVRTYFNRFGMEDRILEFPVSSATVELAAQALNCDPAGLTIPELEEYSRFQEWIDVCKGWQDETK